MCGIVGLFLKNPELEPRLGAMLAGMLSVMSDRGPDSAGFAVYGTGDADHVKFTLRAEGAETLSRVADALEAETGIAASGEARETHLVLTVRRADADRVRDWLAAERPGIAIVGTGSRPH